ncbi:hypothetical protein E2C01_024137 [Portunus trituberculatus]|uniref:Uncharacterized protein n=1 Tax=Portunus trituberculatus TaxID=210409 RepID=A0A5B7ECC8_PORTR|nr:hypothetical protein [Portunus trituberculatus]
MPPKTKERWTLLQAGHEPQTNSRQKVTVSDKNDENNFGIRHGRHHDEALKPVRKERLENILEKEWEQEIKKCQHPRWDQENFLGHTYFTCEKCGNRRRQAVTPMSFKLCQEFEDWFDDCYPPLSSPSSLSASLSSSFHSKRLRRNEWVLYKQQNLLRREQHPAGVAKTVSSDDMIQSETYRRITAQVHASTTKVNSEMQALARRYIAALQVSESRLSCKNVSQRKKQNNQHSESEGTQNENEENFEKGEEQKTKIVVPRLKVRDIVLGGYFYACVTFQHVMFVEGKVFHRLMPVHQRLRLMFPGLSRDFSTLTYLEALIPMLFPHLNTTQNANLQATSLRWIYSAALLQPQIPKRSLICCSLIAISAEIDHNLSKENVRFLQDLDCNYKKWRKVMSVLGHLAAKLTKHVSQPSQPQVEQRLDEDEIDKE